MNYFHTFIKKLSTSQKTLIVILFDFVISYVSFIFAYELRLEGIWNDLDLVYELVNKAFIVAAVQIAVFYFFGLYRGIWRFSSIPDLVRIIKGVTIAIPVALLFLYVTKQIGFLPRSIFIIQWVLLIMGVGGGRFVYRILSEKQNSKNIELNHKTRRALIIGAGHATQLLIRDIKSDPESSLYVVGILDDDIEKRKKILLGINVLGAVSDLLKVAEENNVNEIIIAIPEASKKELARIVSFCKGTKLLVRTIPRFSDLVSGKVEVSKLRRVTPDDLLGRDEVDLDLDSMKHLIEGKTILVTGAGGSIGSELCHQILKLNPAKLVCYDISELNLYSLENKLDEFSGKSVIKMIIGDVRDKKRVNEVFNKNKPQIVFHAAAYKHVPLMEENPLEAIKVNVLGTKRVAEASVNSQVEKFVLVSTDKAVNPTNVMGTSKRIAEMLCQSLQSNNGKTSFTVVRFGNVLGSSGSVIPRFQQQIEQGGPVTVTHPDIIRYFMSIPEAARLVVQAGALGKKGEILVLDMGDPVKITDLAKQMITLAGFKVDEDIEISFTGLRPGEKLYEELLMKEEETLPTSHPRVRVAKVYCEDSKLETEINELLSLKDNHQIRNTLKGIVPEYQIPDIYNLND